MDMTTKFAAIKLIKHDTLLVKELKNPVAFKLNIVDPLTTAQMGMLALASPYKPLIITAKLGSWNNQAQAMDAEVNTIESLSKPPTLKHRNVLRWGLSKRKRGFLAHDC